MGWVFGRLCPTLLPRSSRPPRLLASNLPSPRLQCGFALLEAGTVRSKNTKNILLKNLLDACIGTPGRPPPPPRQSALGSQHHLPTPPQSSRRKRRRLARPRRHHLVGMGHGSRVRRQRCGSWQLLYRHRLDGPRSLPGRRLGRVCCVQDAHAPSTPHPHCCRFALHRHRSGFTGYNGYTMSLWFFQYVFAAAAATIVSGAVAERAQLGAYLCYTIVITGFIYPVVVHWVWCNNGFLSGAFTADKSMTFYGGCLDFAGSGVVHMTGGVAALCGAIVIQPRLGRFDERGKPVPMPGQSTPFQVLGTFILWMGWYGFNPVPRRRRLHPGLAPHPPSLTAPPPPSAGCDDPPRFCLLQGSTLGITPAGYGTIMARAAMCTTLSAGVGGVTVVFFDRIFSKQYDVGMVCNGILAGLVSITAGCACMLPYAAFLTGFIGAFVYYGAPARELEQPRDRWGRTAS